MPAATTATTTMLLGAAKYLAEDAQLPRPRGAIFQPAEEDGGGGDVMVREGMLDRFGIGEVYAIHNTPQVPLGHFLTTRGRSWPPSTRCASI